MAKKIWRASSCLADHISVAASIPKIFDAYVGCNAVPPVLNEEVMLAVNSVNECPYCTGLHGELARMAGVEKPQEILITKTISKARVLLNENEHAAAVEYAQGFGTRNGRGEGEAKAFEDLQKAYGPGQAASIRALCWFLLWGSIGGNTVNAFLFCRMCSVFELLFFIYYGPLFLVIWILMKVFKLFPRVPGCLSATIGFVLTTCASVWILPVALVAVLTCQRGQKSYASAREPQGGSTYHLLDEGSETHV